MGIVICGAGIGGIVYPIMFREMFVRLSKYFLFGQTAMIGLNLPVR